ncbi:MAG: hypothetical protein AAF635_08555 [Cyanobacteria bacterium P01_C01_bin.69]
MTNNDLFNTKSSVPALLAIRRFVKGALQHVGLGLVSLLVILNIAGASPAEEALSTNQDSSRIALSSSLSQTNAKTPAINSNALETGNANTAITSGMSTSAAPVIIHRPYRILHSKMTAHRLTSARLSVPKRSRVALGNN